MAVAVAVAVAAVVAAAVDREAAVAVVAVKAAAAVRADAARAAVVRADVVRAVAIRGGPTMAGRVEATAAVAKPEQVTPGVAGHGREWGTQSLARYKRGLEAIQASSRSRYRQACAIDLPRVSRYLRALSAARCRQIYSLGCRSIRVTNMRWLELVWRCSRSGPAQSQPSCRTHSVDDVISRQKQSRPSNSTPAFIAGDIFRWGTRAAS